jgi:hypothetical protein
VAKLRKIRRYSGFCEATKQAVTCEAMAAQTPSHRYEGVVFLSMRPEIHALVKALGHSSIANAAQFGDCPRPSAAQLCGRGK